ncbi:MAG: nucleotide exchange factor GrpE [Chloroflexi bacterium]|nr:MAG: nucleotide exchange factor GrpE [Chloroflexota bacterium]TME90617.1 MAG: nucleotide exchange factor GrpE [Chloroflexota bacterium]
MSVQSDESTPKRQETEPVNGAQPESADDLERLRAELAEIEQKADEYLRLAQRTQADFINYRRRVDEERAQQARDATVSFLQRLLPILDDFERALANATPADLESSWGRGVQLVERNLRGLLAAEDVQRIPAEGAEFDPREHEALGRQPSPDVPEGHVLHVVRQGYKKGDRVIRPAQVIIASRPE